MSNLPVDEQYICCGLGCFNMTIFTNCQHSRGISISNECCCCLHECCYNERDPMSCFDKKYDHIARIGCCCDACTIKYPNVFCKQTCHTCCLVSVVSIPTYEDSPCLLSCCFCTCYPKWAHCFTIEQLKPK
jgi:hypothetical protein